MKRRTITILTIIMGISFLSLLVMQMRYVDEIFGLRKQHFDESVKRALAGVSHQLELSETARYIEQGSDAYKGIATATDSVFVNNDSTAIQRTRQVTAKDGSVFKILETSATTTVSDKYFTKRPNNSFNKSRSLSRSLQQIMNQRYNYEKSLVDEVIYSILYTASDRPLQDRINFKELDGILKKELSDNGIGHNYHFSVWTNNGQCVYQCSDYDPTGEQHAFTETLFKNDPVQKMGVLKVHFPDISKYIYSSLMFLLPSVIFTIILLVTFIITMVMMFRQKKLSEVKNDFINNMTHNRLRCSNVSPPPSTTRPSACVSKWKKCSSSPCTSTSKPI